MKRTIFLLVVLATLQFAQPSKWQDQIEKINTAMIESVMNGTPEATIPFYTDDAVSMPSYMPMMVGKEALAESAKEQNAEDVKWLSFELNTKFVWESGSFVVEIGNYEYSMEMPMLPEPYVDNGKYMSVYEVQADGTLKIKAETWNTDQNPWAMMAPPPPPPEGDMPPPPPEKE